MDKVNRNGSSIIATLMVSGLLLAGCGSSGTDTENTATTDKMTNPTSEIATQVYKNGQVYTVMNNKNGLMRLQ